MTPALIRLKNSLEEVHRLAEKRKGQGGKLRRREMLEASQEFRAALEQLRDEDADILRRAEALNVRQAQQVLVRSNPEAVRQFATFESQSFAKIGVAREERQFLTREASQARRRVRLTIKGSSGRQLQLELATLTTRDLERSVEALGGVENTLNDGRGGAGASSGTPSGEGAGGGGGDDRGKKKVQGAWRHVLSLAAGLVIIVGNTQAMSSPRPDLAAASVALGGALVKEASGVLYGLFK